MPSFKVVIPSALHENLRECIRSLLKNAPELGRSHLIVVDDGARSGYPEAPVTWVTGVKPFVFARNANLGIREGGNHDIVLMNDDATLVTPSGFSKIATFVAKTKGVGVCSSAISGFVGNKRQNPIGKTPRQEKTVLAFVCVYIPRSTLDTIGLLDERFVGYGADDVDFCRRALRASFDLWVHDGCVVHHGGRSTFRQKSNISELLAINRSLYLKKKKEEGESSAPQ